MTTVPLSEAKTRLSQLVDSVSRTHERVLITRNGRESALLVSVEDYESLEATLELLQDEAAQQRVARSLREVTTGEVSGRAELEALLAARRGRG